MLLSIPFFEYFALMNITFIGDYQNMDFERRSFRKMFFFIKKVPVLMKHLKKNVCYDSLLQVPFCEEKSVQLFRVAFFQSDFLQNPYFRISIGKVENTKSVVPSAPSIFSIRI